MYLLNDSTAFELHPEITCTGEKKKWGSKFNKEKWLEDIIDHLHIHSPEFLSGYFAPVIR
jgi:hypothetical protein